uniref:Ig-like domain-containing protein n=1 Tax=Oryzias latipes TaxID=8090 RepID=A0A3P9LII1_ORYLA
LLVKAHSFFVFFTLKKKIYIYIYFFLNQTIILAGQMVMVPTPTPGDDVILPCCLDSQEDLQDHIVEWIKVDMKHFVFLYWRRKIITEQMNESLIPRVSLNQDGLKRGDVTLKIRNVSLQDEGKYSCFIPGKNFRETVQLKSFFLFSLFPGEPIIAAPGDDVILPCRLDSQEDLQDQAVEWFKLDMKRFVFLYWSRKIITEHMSESLIPRVFLDQDGLKRGDVTLKIRNVSLQDEGKYSCFIPGKNFRETVHGSRPALWILLGLFPSLILSVVCVCVFQRKQPEVSPEFSDLSSFCRNLQFLTSFVFFM